MAAGFALLLSLALHAHVCLAQGEQDQRSVGAVAALPLIRLEAVTSIAGDIGEGGFDARIRGGRWFFSKLNRCGVVVAETGKKWAREYKLSVLKEATDEQDTTLHIGSGSQEGFFELLYRYRASPEQASISLLFYDQAGLPRSPELSSLRDLGIDALAADLQKALKCNP